MILHRSQPTILLLVLALLFLAACGENATDNEARCLAAPTCGPGEEEVDECPSGESCYESSICGQTILCQEEVLDCTLQDQCPDPSVEVDSCDELDDCFIHHTCDDILYCDATTECVPPTCPEGSDEVAECPTDGECSEITDCEETILCEEIEECTDLPQCEPDEEELSMGDCPEGDTCYDIEVCEVQITCVIPGPDLCSDEGLCPSGFSEVADEAACTSDGADSTPNCLTIDLCGDELFCTSDIDTNCDEPYEACPEGFAAADCDLGDNTCLSADVCDEVVMCESL